MIRLLLLPIIILATSDKLSVSEPQQSFEHSSVTVVPVDASRNVSKKSIQNLMYEIEVRKNGLTTVQIDPRLFKTTNTKRANSIKRQKQKPKSLKSIIKSAEYNHGIPENLLLAIAKVETGVRPYTLNYNGRGYSFGDITTAVNFAKGLVNRGQTNFSVGCFQLHYPAHKNKFKSLEDMFNPQKNTIYAAKLLKTLFTNKGYNWKNAVKAYHSGYEVSNCIYYTKIVNKLGRQI